MIKMILIGIDILDQIKYCHIFSEVRGKLAPLIALILAFCNLNLHKRNKSKGPIFSTKQSPHLFSLGVIDERYGKIEISSR